MTTFGQILSEACDRQGVTHYRLAQLLKVQQSRVPQIMRAKNLTERTFKRCAGALGLELRVRLVKKGKR